MGPDEEYVCGHFDVYHEASVVNGKRDGPCHGIPPERCPCKKFEAKAAGAKAQENDK